MYHVGDRSSKLYHAASPANINNFETTHNAIIRIQELEQATVNQMYYPRQLQVHSHQKTPFSKFDFNGLQGLDKYNNWYYRIECFQWIIIVHYYVAII